MLTSKKVSESIRLGSILMFSGGFLDAYSYLVRGQVFATAETGNIALMGISLARGDLAVAGRYLIPWPPMRQGIFLTEWIRMRVGENGTVHWKEGICGLELLVMVLAGFMPQKWNSLVNCLIGFSCCPAGRSVPEDAWHGLRYDHVYRKFKKRDRASGRGNS